MPRSRSRLLLPLLIAAAALGLLASAIYVPSIPDMARDFAVPVGEVQHTLTVFLATFALGMLLLGPLSDRLGRRRVLLAGTSICFVASIGCALAPGIGFLVACRVPQAFGACAGMVVARAMVRDLYDREGAAQAMAAIAMAVTLAPAVAPMLGGQLHGLFGWRANFAFVALFCAALVGVAWWRLPETNKQLQVQTSLVRYMTSSYRILLGDRRFFAYALAIAGGGACFYAFAAGAPVILIDGFGVSPGRYGVYAAVPPLGFMSGSFLSNRLTRRFGIDRLVRIGSLVLLTAGLLMAGLAASSIAGPFAVIGPMLLIGIGNGLMMPNAFAGSISLHPQIAGAASGLAGFLQMIGAAVSTVAVTLLPNHSALALALLLTGAGLFAAGAFRLFISSSRAAASR
jgi:MFS transporter, DHA1 family, multidrug resistance protein